MNVALSRLKIYARILRLHQPIGNFLLLWPTWWALWLAGQGHPSVKLVVLFTLGILLMRAFGCLVNDMADRNFDGSVKRTKTRPLVTREMTLKEAYGLFIALGLLALYLVLQLNRFTFYLSFIGLGFALAYPFCKRFTYWPQAVLGCAFSWGIPMVFAAQTNTIPPIAWLLFITAALWPLAYDTLYAMVDREDDRKIGVKSTAILFEHNEHCFIGMVQIGFIILWLMIAYFQHLNAFFYIALGLASLLFGYQHRLIQTKETSNYFKAFLNNNWIGALLFLGLLLGMPK